eukprot:scpid50842/ scgid2707/ Netrin receptor UNC5C; Protein unc-5 homolog 3; Protein unc-5 homolog C
MQKNTAKLVLAQVAVVAIVVVQNVLRCSTAVISTPTSSPACSLSTGNTSQLDGPGCRNESDVTVPWGCPKPVPVVLGNFQQLNSHPRQLSLLFSFSDVDGYPEACLARFSLVLPNGTEQHCMCLYIALTDLVKTTLIVSDNSLQSCVASAGFSDVYYRPALSVVFTALPLVNATEPGRQIVSGTILLKSCVENYCLPDHCLERCVPLRPDIMVQNSSDDGISIDILSKPRFPVTSEGTVNVTYIGYHVLVTSLQDDDDIIANFTAWPIENTSFFVTVPERLRYSSLRTKVRVVAKRDINLTLSYLLLGEIQTFLFIVVNGTWSPWQTGACSAACGNGTRVSTRYCIEPQNGGVDCVPGNTTHVQRCYLRECLPPHWSNWERTSPCVLCQPAMYTRQCLADPPPELVNTTECGEHYVERRDCPCNSTSPSNISKYFPLIFALPVVLAITVLVIICRIRPHVKTSLRDCFRRFCCHCYCHCCLQSPGHRLQRDDLEMDELLGSGHHMRTQTMPLASALVEMRRRLEFESCIEDQAMCIYISHDRQSDAPVIRLASHMTGVSGCQVSVDVLQLEEIRNAQLHAHPTDWLEKTLFCNQDVNDPSRMEDCECHNGIGACHHLPNSILFFCTPAMKEYFDVHESQHQHLEVVDGDAGIPGQHGYRMFLDMEMNIASRNMSNVIAVVPAGRDGCADLSCLPDSLQCALVAVHNDQVDEMADDLLAADHGPVPREEQAEGENELRNEQSNEELDRR